LLFADKIFNASTLVFLRLPESISSVTYAYLVSAYALKGEPEHASTELAAPQRHSDNHYPTQSATLGGGSASTRSDA
jgi:hypothetical protein